MPGAYCIQSEREIRGTGSNIPTASPRDLRGPTEVANNTMASCLRTVRYIGTNVSERHFVAYIFSEIVREKAGDPSKIMCLYTRRHKPEGLHLLLYPCRLLHRAPYRKKGESEAG